MKELLKCRRSIISIYAITLLFILGYNKNIEVSVAISTVAVGLAGANAYEKRKQYKKKDSPSSYLND
jgi:hypothetical protein